MKINKTRKLTMINYFKVFLLIHVYFIELKIK